MSKKTRTEILAKKISDLMIEMRHALTQENLAMSSQVTPSRRTTQAIQEVELSNLETTYRSYCLFILAGNERARSEVR